MTWERRRFLYEVSFGILMKSGKITLFPSFSDILRIKYRRFA